MSTLTEFLLARITEDEAEARALMAGAQHAELSLQDPKRLGEYQPGFWAWPRVENLTARVLAECKAKRDIIVWRRAFAAVSEDPATELATRLTSGGAVDGLDAAIKAHAAVYSDHPDYQPEWKS